MINYSVESKSQLAKLLATENINIEHRNAPTASFNLKTRTLICPIWKDMSGQMYDLLLGHEVSHALETPLEGWHDAVCEKGQNYKHFLNVVEDARIEKKIKRRYPGIRRSFIGAYKQLIEEDFFGIKDKNLDDMFLIDRLNIYCKAGVATNITFKNDEEKALLKLVEDAETWNDVLFATDKVWEYSKQEQQQELPQQQTVQYVYDENGDYIEEDLTNDEEAEDSENSDSQENADENEEQKSDEEAEDSENSDTQENSELDSESTQISHDNDDSEKEDFGDPKCETDEVFRKNEIKMLSDEVKTYTYISIPKLKTKTMFIDTDTINEEINSLLESNQSIKVKSLYDDFKSKNEKYINLLAKEFEMRKAAKSYSRTKVASTGDINLSKIYKYQLDDEIFRKVSIVPKGKSHGLVMLLDMSGSMGNNMSGSIEQILVLTMFCKKVNIPFKVYGFNSNHNGINTNDCFEQEQNTLQFANFKLIEFINSDMNSTQLNKTIQNLCGLIKVYDKDVGYLSINLALGRTPLIESMITLQPIVKEFKKTKNLDIVNLVIVHDGDADDVINFKSPGMQTESIKINERQKYVLRDTKEKLDFELKCESYLLSEGIRDSIYKWFTQTTGTKIFGFFITGDSKYQIRYSLENRYYDTKTGAKPSFDNNFSAKYQFYDELAKKLKTEKFIVSKNPGYESFYLIVGGKNLQIEDEELKVTGKATTSKLINSLRKLTKNKSSNRVLASQFIQGIAV